MISSTRNVWIAGVTIIALTNIVALAGVAYNRGDAPEVTFTLSERELALPYSWVVSQENSGLSLRIQWRSPAVDESGASSSVWSPIPWLDEAKLSELGFDVRDVPKSEAGRRRVARSLPRDVFLVLEFDGPTYRAPIAQAERDLQDMQAVLSANPDDKDLVRKFEEATDRLNNEKTTASRLLVIDAGLDATQLRGKYTDRDRYVILRGVVRADVEELRHELWRVAGRVQNLAVEEVNVPSVYRDIFEPWIGDQDETGPDPQSSVTLAFGRRFEPWITAVE